MATWTTELKEQVIKMYKDAEPTAENSVEIIADIADEIGQSPNGVRQVLVQAQVYVKKDATATKTTKTPTGESKRVPKEAQLDALRAAISERGGVVDEDIISKLTGKAALYLTTVLNLK